MSFQNIATCFLMFVVVINPYSLFKINSYTITMPLTYSYSTDPEPLIARSPVHTESLPQLLTKGI